MQLPKILVQEVLLRLPPAEPASFLRAAAVCKRWRHLIFARSFVLRLHEFHRIDSPFVWARGEEMEEGEQEAAAVTTPPTLRRSQRLAQMSAATTPAPMHRSARKAVEMTPPTLRRSQRLSARKDAATLPPTPATLPSLQEAAESMILVSGPRRSGLVFIPFILEFPFYWVNSPRIVLACRAGFLEFGGSSTIGN